MEIGSGKSSVAGALRERGALIIDADKVAHQIMEPGRPGFGMISCTGFGSRSSMKTRTINREKLEAICF